jgi:hypothetical protein
MHVNRHTCALLRPATRQRLARYFVLRACVIHKLTRPGYQRNTLNAVLQHVRPLRCRLRLAPHFESEIRDTIAKFPQRKILHHDIRQTTISRRFSHPLKAFNIAIGQLVFRAFIDTIAPLFQVNLLGIRPNAQHLVNGAFTYRHRKAHGIAIRGGGLRCTTASATFPPTGGAGRARHPLFNGSRPDDIPAQPHHTVNQRNHLAIGRGLHRQIRQARPLDTRQCPTAKHRPIQRCPYVTPKARPKCCANRATSRPAQSRTNRPQNDRSHDFSIG